MSAPRSAAATFGRLLGQVGRYRLVLFLSMLAVALDAAGQGLFVYLLKPLIDDTFVAMQPRLGPGLLLLVLGAIVLRVVGNFGGVFGMQWVGRRLIADLRQAVFQRYLLLPARFFDQNPSGQLISRLTYNTEQVAEAATTALIGAIRDILTVIAYITVMLYLSWRLTLTMLVLVPVVALVVTVISRRFRRISRRIQDSMGDVTHVTEEAVKGHLVVKVFGGTGQEGDAFATINERNRRLHLKLTVTQLASSSLIQLAAGLALIILLLIATSGMMRADVTAGTFTAVLAAMVAAIPPLKRLTKVHALIERGVAAAHSLFDVLDMPAEPDTGDQALDRARGEISLRGVSFSYPDAERPVLDDVSFELPRGSTTALVGRSGSGKSSLVKLLPRFYSPTAGQITLDGRPLDDIRLSDLRRQIALVSQDVVLFNDTVARNIAYGELSGASRQAIEEAAEAAHAMAFIRELPQGLDTPIGQGGGLLSGGQRQRIAIARALLKDAPILILDEATSALDTESERAVRDALARLMQGRTTLVIAHRLSTVEQADQVVVLDAGRVVERGRHDELMAVDSLYRHLYRLQLSDTPR